MFIMIQERPLGGALEIHKSSAIRASTLAHPEFPGDAAVGRFVRLSSANGPVGITLATARELLANLDSLD